MCLSILHIVSFNQAPLYACIMRENGDKISLFYKITIYRSFTELNTIQ